MCTGTNNNKYIFGVRDAYRYLNGGNKEHFLKEMQKQEQLKLDLHISNGVIYPGVRRSNVAFLTIHGHCKQCVHKNKYKIFIQHNPLGFGIFWDFSPKSQNTKIPKFTSHRSEEELFAMLFFILHNFKCFLLSLKKKNIQIS